jgi:hypothetical protein
LSATSVSTLASWSTSTSRSWVAFLMAAATASTAGRQRRQPAEGSATTTFIRRSMTAPGVAFSQVLPDERAMTAALFLIEAAGFFADHGVQIQRLLTDNAKAYAESVVFAETAAGLGIKLRRTRPFRPRPTPRSSDSPRPCCRNGPLRGYTAPITSDAGPCVGGCASTIGADHTPRSTASPRWRSLSTTSTGNTARAA